MKRILGRMSPILGALLTVGFLPAVMQTPAGAADPLFAPLRGFELADEKVRVAPRKYAVTRVDLARLRATLRAAPAEGSSAGLVFAVPRPDGRVERFRVQQTSVLEPELAAAHPELATYAGRGVDNPKLSVVLDVTPMGFHAAVRGPTGRRGWYVDPAYNRRGTTTHLIYRAAELSQDDPPLADQVLQRPLRVQRSDSTVGAAGAAVVRRTYRLALLNDPTYAAYFGTDNVLAEKVTLINRVNQVYNDLAVRLVLVNPTDDLNLDTAAMATGAGGPCGSAPCYSTTQLNRCSGSQLTQSRTVLSQLIGASRYDLGHMLLGKSGGGVAYLGVAGWDDKSGGCSGLATPVGDYFAVDYLAHEMGHQFRANHTFDGAEFNCSGDNRWSGSSVEPGSGSSVMGYAGICHQDDLQKHSDPYFSQRSLAEISDFVSESIDPIAEVQTVSLRGFDENGDTFVLGYPGADPVTITRGPDYDSDHLEQHIEDLTGADEVTVAQWGYDPWATYPDYPAAPGEPSDAGFQVVFNADGGNLDVSSAVAVDWAALTVEPGAADAEDVSAIVGETAQGGAVLNGGTVGPPTGNHAPDVTAPADRTLPVRTPFTLTGSATDEDDDALTYLWEQNDIGGSTGTDLLSNTKRSGPLFRVFSTASTQTDEDSLESPAPGANHPDDNPSRTFPDLAQILAGNTNAKTGNCPTVAAYPTPVPPASLDCFSEFLPTPGYVGTAGSSVPRMHFRLTARDGFVNGAGIDHDDVVLRIDPGAGPFEVDSLTSGGTRTGGEPFALTWMVNDTDRLAANVKISLSADGGLSYPTVLSWGTPNDGSHTIRWPNVDVERARIKIEAVGNYFFDINDADFQIVKDITAPVTTITSGPPAGGFVLSTSVKFGYASSQVGSTFVCKLDGRVRPCGTTGTTLTDLKPGKHTFSVAARDGAGNLDATPLSRTWAHPLDDRSFTLAGGFAKRWLGSTYLGTYSEARRTGASLSKTFWSVRKIALVVSKGSGHGSVDVIFGGKRLATVNLAGTPRRQVLVNVKTFSVPTSGKLVIRATSNKLVQIEGVGVLIR
jgi:hypothetical protein